MKRLYSIVIILCLTLVLAGCSNQQQEAEELQMDKDTATAYGLVEAASESFKDPSSVRVLGGSMYYGDGESIACVKVSATNSYGARNTSYYFIDQTGNAMEVKESTINFYNNEKGKETAYASGFSPAKYAAFLKNDLDCDAINEKLKEKWQVLD